MAASGDGKVHSEVWDVARVITPLQSRGAKCYFSIIAFFHSRPNTNHHNAVTARNFADSERLYLLPSVVWVSLLLG